VPRRRAQVSHHIHCNDEALDEDVFSAFPLLRFDPRLPRSWFHQFQHIYMWAMFPLLQVAFQVRAGARSHLCSQACALGS
jgi:fatty acid desaturase (delta-4 desaturase)